MAKCKDKYLPAQMDKFISIEQVTRDSDGMGGFDDTWSQFATAWCIIKPMSSYERFQANQMETPTTHKITMRYMAGVTTAMRIIYESRVFEIKGIVNENEDDIYLKINALEKV